MFRQFTKTKNITTAIKNFNTTRFHHAPALIFGGMIGGMAVGTSVAASYAVINVGLDYKKSRKIYTDFDLEEKAADATMTTMTGFGAGVVIGSGLGLIAVVPEIALLTALATLAYNKRKDRAETQKKENGVLEQQPSHKLKR